MSFAGPALKYFAPWDVRQVGLPRHCEPPPRFGPTRYRPPIPQPPRPVIAPPPNSGIIPAQGGPNLRAQSHARQSRKGFGAILSAHQPQLYRQMTRRVVH
jgi:hypothetical protein